MSRPTRRILLVVCAAVLPLACSGPPTAPDASDGSMVTLCSTNAECAGGFCDGTRLCVPGAAEADARGCVTVTPACGAGEVCDAELERCVPACEVPDADGDGVDSVECGGSDCDDNDANRYPGNAEVCDAANVDEDCNPSTFGARDDDGDGYVDARCCNADAGGVMRCGNDCDDSRASVSPEGTEVCNGLDDDCDPTTFAPGEDDDGDGVADAACGGTDCDDECATCGPNPRDELCDGRDQDCDGTIDEGVDPSLFTEFYVDADGDGLGDESMPGAACVVPAGHSATGGDCNDGDGRVGACSAPLTCAAGRACGCRVELLNNAEWLDLDRGQTWIGGDHAEQDVIVDAGDFGRMHLRVNGTGTFFRRYEPADFVAVDSTYTGGVTSTGTDPMEWTPSTVYVVRTSNDAYYKLGYLDAPGTGRVSFTYAPIAGAPSAFVCAM